MQAKLCEDIEGLLERLAAANPVGWDLETLGCNPKIQHPLGRARPYLMSVAFYWEGVLESYVIGPDDILKFKPWLEDPSRLKVGSNIVHYDSLAMLNVGVEVRGLFGDTLHMSRLLNPDRFPNRLGNKYLGHGLKDWCQLLGIQQTTYDAVTSRPRHSSTPRVYKTEGTSALGWHVAGAEVYDMNWESTEQIPLDELWEHYPQRRQALLNYAAIDAVAHLRVFEELKKRLENVAW